MLQPQVVAAAARRLDGIANQTPVFQSTTLNERSGGQVFLKGEHLQRVGAFKFRGAFNAVSQLSDAQQAAGVITHSSGNHAQGLALAAKLC
ncbi:MAG: pyridoxal-phosphate dependent enzyme, partial [Anaerolineales bacterium]|nr:pyridoxal-phosphate dependent enzyme [Anaerolineales bacterium]